MNRFIDKVELIAGLLLGGIALLTFSAVMARWLFNYEHRSRREVNR